MIDEASMIAETIDPHRKTPAPQQAPKEYIVTEELRARMIKTMADAGLNNLAVRLMNESRPRRAAPAQPINGCWYYDHNVCGLPHPSPNAEEHDAAIARQTLAGFAKELIAWLDQEIKEWPEEEVWYDSTLEKVKDHINESLRSTQHPGQEEPR